MTTPSKYKDIDLAKAPDRYLDGVRIIVANVDPDLLERCTAPNSMGEPYFDPRREGDISDEDYFALTGAKRRIRTWKSGDPVAVGFDTAERICIRADGSTVALWKRHIFPAPMGRQPAELWIPVPFDPKDCE